MLDPESAIALLDVDFPDLIALEIKAGEVASAGIGVNVFAIDAG
jgi:hypothetical protein